jgi:hypothetical protein
MLSAANRRSGRVRVKAMQRLEKQLIIEQLKTHRSGMAVAIWILDSVVLNHLD